MPLHPPIPPSGAAHQRQQTRGFTLIELVMVIAIIAILATIAVAAYRVYILKAESAQTLVNYGHIRTVIHIKTQVDGLTNLEQDSVPGAVPPALQDSMSNQEFNGPDNTTFQLILAPAGTFASYPSLAAYALVATASNANGVLRLRVLRSVLPFADGDKIWVQASSDAASAQLIYPIDVASASTSGGSGASTTDNNSSASIPPATASSSAPTSSSSTAATGSGGTSTGSGGGTTSGPTSPSTGSSSSASAGSNTSSTGSSGGASGGSSSANTGETTSAGSTAAASSESGITGSGTIDGNTWTASAQICIGSASGGTLTGQNNTSVIFQVVTQYANFQVNQPINATTGCTTYSYSGLPLSSNAQISVVKVVNYNPPDSGGTSTLWDGTKSTLTIQP